MDAIDRIIVRSLQQNGRLTNNDLAEKVNLSPSPCLRRVRKLEEEGVIKGYTTLVDHEKYGFPLCVFVNIRLERQTNEVIRLFEKHIQDIEEIMECYLLTGNFDYVLRVVSPSLKDYETFVKEKLTRIPGVGALETRIAFGTIKRTTVYPRHKPD
ncbi:MAG: Lrp/AsnC family transcriptional regulator [Alphaproteobacteria bacterium]|nr:Lrp/AsnC family transcriptional regulator [Alphaproteobacteria bacterium]